MLIVPADISEYRNEFWVLPQNHNLDCWLFYQNIAQDWVEFLRQRATKFHNMSASYQNELRDVIGTG